MRKTQQNTAKPQSAKTSTRSQGAISKTPPKYGVNFIDRQTVAPFRREGRKKGLPSSLKAGIEHLSKISMDDVNVNYNSPKPAQLQAKAYTQGTDIHVGPGHERHLAHEAWHVVQQKQGRVQPTMWLRGIRVNNDRGLEREAAVMGAKANALDRRFKPE